MFKTGLLRAMAPGARMLTTVSRPVVAKNLAFSTIPNFNLATKVTMPQTLSSVYPATATRSSLQILSSAVSWGPVLPVVEPVVEEDDNTVYMDSVLRKRRLKMKKHKLRKRRKRQRSLKIRLGKI